MADVRVPACCVLRCPCPTNPKQCVNNVLLTLTNCMFEIMPTPDSRRTGLNDLLQLDSVFLNMILTGCVKSLKTAGQRIVINHFHHHVSSQTSEITVEWDG